LNGRAFRLYGFSWDFEGNVVSWNSGRLEQELGHRLALSLYPQTVPSGNWKVRLSEQERAAISGDKELSSSNPILRKMNLRVVSMTAFLE
jgi:hypothetical protein